MTQLSELKFGGIAPAFGGNNVWLQTQGARPWAGGPQALPDRPPGTGVLGGGRSPMVCVTQSSLLVAGDTSASL